MAPSISRLITLIILLAVVKTSVSKRHLYELVQNPPLSIPFHNGHVLYGNTTINLIWYGKFKPFQKSIIADFIISVTSHGQSPKQLSVSDWWATTHKYYRNSRRSLTLSLGDQINDESYSLGKSLTDENIATLASRGKKSFAINVVLTSADVVVSGFCMSRCGTHASGVGPRDTARRNLRSRYAYIWVGNSETQCPGECAWPFHRPIYGPQTAPLISPNGDVGVDGMVISLASLLAGTVTNPFGNGYYQGDADVAYEVGSACTGNFGSGAYPGYPGKLLVDPSTGASYNTCGIGGRKYLVPALYDPETLSCSTLV